MMIALPFIVLILLLLLGVPIAFSLFGAAALGIWLLTGDGMQIIAIAGTSAYSSIADYSLTAVPMFILMAYFASRSGVATDLFNAAANCLSWVRGGLAIATVFASAVFGALSGASVAAAAVMSEIAIPNMRKHGYSDELASGSVAVGATTDILIPPSIALVIYGMLTDTSLGQLLVAGIIPGLLLAVVISAVIVSWVTINPSIAPATYTVPWNETLASLLRVWPSLLLISSVLLLLYSGIATATEVGAIGALLSAVLAAVLGRLSWEATVDAVHRTIRGTAMIFVIFIGAKLFGYYITMTQIPQVIVDWVLHVGLRPWLVIVGIIVSYFVISMFMDEVPLMMLTLPITFPVVTALGYDPIWFGILTMMMVAMGLVFPPVGMVAFVVSSAGRVNLVSVYKGCTVLITAIFITTALIMIFPDIVTYLPRTMRG